MAKNTEHLGLYEKESTDGNDTFNVQSMMNDNWDKIDQFAKDTDDKILNLGTTSNSGNAYSVSAPDGFTLKDNQLLIVKFNATSTGEISLNVGSIGAKPVKDYFGNAVTNVSANLPAILSYESESDSFILSGKGGDGTATAPDILEGKTATTKNGLVTGTMKDYSDANLNVLNGGTAIQNINSSGHDANGWYSGLVFNFNDSRYNYTGKFNKNTQLGIGCYGLAPQVIKAGHPIGKPDGSTGVGTFTADADAVAGDIRDGKSAYVNGQKVSGSCPVQATAAQTITPGTTDIVKPAGIYDGPITIKGIQPSDIGGRKYAEGIFTGTNTGFTVSNLTFSPSVLIFNYSNDTFNYAAVYVKNIFKWTVETNISSGGDFLETLVLSIQSNGFTFTPEAQDASRSSITWKAYE